MFGFNLIGYEFIKLFDRVEHLRLKSRMAHNMAYNIKSLKYTLYKTNPELSEPFYMAGKSTPIWWNGKPALLGVAKKISIPVQTNLFGVVP